MTNSGVKRDGSSRDFGAPIAAAPRRTGLIPVLYANLPSHMSINSSDKGRAITTATTIRIHKANSKPSYLLPCTFGQWPRNPSAFFPSIGSLPHPLFYKLVRRFVRREFWQEGLVWLGQILLILPSSKTTRSMSLPKAGQR